MKTVLLYHIYPINNWQEITTFLFQKLPFQRIVVHVSLPDNNDDYKQLLEDYFKRYPVDEILYTLNSGKGEVDALKSFVQTQDLREFDTLTYMHCKGVTKPGNYNVLAWTRLMRYFIIEKMDVCEKAFKKGFVTFGVNKSIPSAMGEEGFRNSNFFYEGNFISVNLKKVDLAKALIIHLEECYYGLEGFWGKLCTYQEGYSPFDSGINHYLMPIEEKDYNTSLARLKYRVTKYFYRVKSRIKVNRFLELTKNLHGS